MPYRIAKGSGPRPFKIIRSDTGKQVGSSKTKAEAERAIRARHMAEHGVRMKGK